MEKEKKIPVSRGSFHKWVHAMSNEFRTVSGFDFRDAIRTSFKRTWHNPYVYTNANTPFDSVLSSNDAMFAVYIGKFGNDHIVRITNLKTGKTGVAKFNYREDEDFMIDVGLALAWARYCRKDIFEINENLFDPRFAKKGDRFKSTINGNKYILIENRKYTDGYHCICYPSDGTRPATVSIEDFSHCEKMKEGEDL